MKVKLKDIMGVYAEMLPLTADDNDVLNYEVDEAEIGQAFGATLKTARSVKKLSLNELSKLVDIPNPSISRYENGLVIPTIPQAIKLASYFDLTVEQFIFLGIAGLKGGNITELYEKHTAQMKAARETLQALKAMK